MGTIPNVPVTKKGDSTSPFFLFSSLDKDLHIIHTSFLILIVTLCGAGSSPPKYG